MKLSEALEKLRQFRANSTQIDPPGVTVPLSLVRSAKLASWMAYWALVYFLLLYTFDIARDRAGTMHFTHVGFWTGDVQVYAPYLFGFVIVAVGIPYVAKIAIPTFMSLDWRMNLWPKLWALFIAVAVSLVVIAGTFTVQGDTLLERDRESAVAVDTVAQEAAVLTARIADTQHRLDEMTRSESAYIRTAASMAPAAYDAFVEARRDDWQYERLRSYRAQSVEAEGLRNQISELRAQQARQTVTSAVAGRVTTTETSWIAATLGWLEGARAILLSLVMDVVCLIMPWIALRLEQARNRQMSEASEPEVFVPAGLVGDHTSAERADMAQARQAAYDVFASGGDAEAAEKAAREATSSKPKKVVDADTGEDLTLVEAHYRRSGRKGKDKQGRLTEEIVTDGGPITVRVKDKTFVTGGVQDERTAMAMSGAMPEEIEDPGFATAAPAKEISISDNENNNPGTDSTLEEITPVSDEDIFAEELAALSPEPTNETPLGEDGSDGVMVNQDAAPVRERETEDA